MSNEIAELIAAELKETSDPTANLEAVRPVTLDAQETEKSEDVETEETNEDEESTEEPEKEPEDEELVTLKSLAADLEIPPEQLYGMRIPVEGHEPMSISELKDAAQGSLDQREDFKEKESKLATLEADLQKREQELYQQADSITPQELVKAEADLQKAHNDFVSVNWQQIEAQNPGEAALMRQKLGEAYQIAQYNRDEILKKQEAIRTEIQTKRDQQMQVQQQRAIEALHSLVPEWKDEAVQRREQEHLVNHYVGLNVNEATLRNIQDPHLVKVLRDAWKQAEVLKEIEPVKKAPKVLKADVVREKGRGKAQADKRFLEHAAKSKDQRVKDEATRKLLQGAGIV